MTWEALAVPPTRVINMSCLEGNFAQRTETTIFAKGTKHMQTPRMIPWIILPKSGSGFTNTSLFNWKASNPVRQNSK